MRSFTAALAILAIAAPVAGAAQHNRHHKRVTMQCPAGIPTQTVTVSNVARASAVDLARVERAATDQSLQLRRAWQTPCVRFGPHGWLLSLRTGARTLSNGEQTCYVDGVHYAGPAVVVETGCLSVSGWARAFTHEIDETLVDPAVDRFCTPTELCEVADPVENWTYTLDGLLVSDFVTPSYFSGGSGSYDQMGALTAPGS